MRWSIPLIFLGVAACDAPLQQLYPPQSFSYTVDERLIDVRTQYDPIEFGWFTRFADRTGRIELEERPLVYALLTEKVGPELCGEAGIDVAPGNVVIGFGATRERYLPDLGVWQLVAHCD